jgi:hypothetical protein
MLPALQHEIKGNIANRTIGAIIAAVEGVGSEVRGHNEKCSDARRVSHAYASFRVLTLYTRDAGHEVVQFT